jgi:hypothetical protein
LRLRDGCAAAQSMHWALPKSNSTRRLGHTAQMLFLHETHFQLLTHTQHSGLCRSASVVMWE